MLLEPGEVLCSEGTVTIHCEHHSLASVVVKEAVSFVLLTDWNSDVHTSIVPAYDTVGKGLECQPPRIQKSDSELA